MKGYLNKDQINYVLFHLNLVFHLTEEIKALFIFNDGSEEINSNNHIVFLLSPHELHAIKIREINNIPVLFPVKDSERMWIIEGNNLIFEHDLFKSAFYLLSGYQEFSNPSRDELGRYSAKESIQYKLGIIKKPLVNYYFREIVTAIEAFLSSTPLKVETKAFFNPFTFMLTHDVDRVKQYSYNYFIYKVKQLSGLRKSGASFKTVSKQIINALLVNLKGGNNDPAWDFDYLRSLERKHNLCSVFYFLDNETRHIDADYDLSEPRIKGLIEELYKEKCEIGYHGNQLSVTNARSLNKGLAKLKGAHEHGIFGIRQHRLRYEIPVTTMIHEEAGFLYDASLGFFNHEGFRNSFCLPFKLFDFKRNQILNVWEIPLTVMDCTLLDYRNLNFGESFQSVHETVHETIKFSGVFSLLWHNGYFDEIRHPGIHGFYEELLDRIMQNNPVNLTGKQIIHVINNL